MTKRIQNKVAESRFALTVVSVFAAIVWLACGLLTQQWWAQGVCLALSTFLVLILNNVNALIRIYSRMVSCCFLLLSCMACYLFEDMKGGIVQLCVVTSYLALFHSYQDKQAMGWVYYSFLCLGLASAVFVQILFYVPVLWLLTAIYLNALSWRTFSASVLGLLTPYWFTTAWFVWEHDTTSLANHFAALGQFQSLVDFQQLTASQWLVIGYVLILTTIGIVHFYRNSYQDKIRTRQLYGFMLVVYLFTVLLMALQPCYHGVLVRILIINAAPFIAHFIALTHSKWTNITFWVAAIGCLLITAFNVWISSSIF